MLETLPRRAERHTRGRRRRGLVILLVLILLIAALAGAAGAYYSWAIGASGPKEKVVVIIPSGATGADVAELLKSEGVIRSPLAFRLVARFRGFAEGFDAGKYHMTTNMTVEEALAALGEGPFVETRSATFPEGYTVRQTAARANEQLGIDPRAFTRLATSGKYSLPPYLPKGTNTIEGFLFPSTYDFRKDATADDVIRRLLDEFEGKTDGLPWDRARALGVTPYQVVVVASMIEEEARFQQDRAKISAVIYNRLNEGMRLQIDATVQYALGATKPGLTYDDLQVDSPYNTYLHTGLPPTPISSPSLASLEAALTPADVDYLYYVVIDAQGHHAFTDDYNEFLRLKDRFVG